MAAGRKLPVSFDGYRVDRTYAIDAATWNATMPDIDRRLRAAEEALKTTADFVARGVDEVIRRIDVAVAPLIAQVNADAAAAAEQLEQLLETGVPADRITETEDRVFVSPAQRAAIDTVPAQIATAIAASNRITARALMFSNS